MHGVDIDVAQNDDEGGQARGCGSHSDLILSTSVSARMTSSNQSNAASDCGNSVVAILPSFGQ